MSALVLVSLGALALGASPEAPGREADRGWVQPAASELTRLIGVRWVEQIGEPGFLTAKDEQWSGPLVTRDHALVIAASSTGKLAARSLEDGDVVWRKENLGAVGASMAELRGRILLSSGSSLLALDDQTGAERWRLDLAGGIGGRIVMTGTVAIIPVRSNAFVAVDAVAGELLWRVRRPTPDGITMRGQAAAAVDAGRVFLGFSDGALLAVTLARGETLWTTTLGKPNEAFADIDADPVVTDGGAAVIAASYSGGLAKLDAATGRVSWKKTELTRLTGLTRAGLDGLLVAGHGDGQVLGIGGGAGTVRWRYRLDGGAPGAPVDLGRGLVLVPSTGGPLAVLEIATGKPLQLLSPGAGGVSAAPSWNNPDLAVLTNKGLLLVARYGDGAGIDL